MAEPKSITILSFLNSSLNSSFHRLNLLASSARRKATRFEMTDNAKLGVMIHIFYSGINNVEKLTENFNL